MFKARCRDLCVQSKGGVVRPERDEVSHSCPNVTRLRRLCVQSMLVCSKIQEGTSHQRASKQDADMSVFKQDALAVRFEQRGILAEASSRQDEAGKFAAMVAHHRVHGMSAAREAPCMVIPPFESDHQPVRLSPGSHFHLDFGKPKCLAPIGKLLICSSPEVRSSSPTHRAAVISFVSSNDQHPR